MARSGMATLISTLRGMTNAGTADYSAGGTVYWSDDQLQLALDRHRAQINNRYVQPVPRVITGGAIEYYDYYIGIANFESGTALAVEDGQGNAYGTALYTVDATRGVVNFPAGNSGKVVAITGQAYDINSTAADVWRVKAAAYASAFDFSTDNHRISRSQLIKNCFDMAALYEEMSPITNHTITRDDTVDYQAEQKEPNRHRQMFGNMRPDQ